jgi:TorA maturation chaperone TorD
VTFSTDLESRWRQAVADDLRLLARLHQCELDAGALDELAVLDFPRGLGLRLQSQAGRQATDFLADALRETHAEDLDALAVDFAAIYLNHGLRASPCESVWFDDEHLICQDAMFQVREWYNRHDLAAADWRRWPDDHLSLQLHFTAHLLSLENIAFDEAARFLDEHPLRWIARFAGRVSERCDTPFYAGLAVFTAQYLEDLRGLLAAWLPRPTPEEIEQRMNPRRSAPVAEALRYMPGFAPSW